jgi:hypothetical protein
MNKRPQKITLGEMRASGVRGLLIYCADYQCSQKSVRKLPIIRTVDGTRKRIIMAKSHLKLVSPTTVKRTVTPRRRPNAELRSREYLTEAEIERPGQSLWPPGRHHDPSGLQAWL